MQILQIPLAAKSTSIEQDILSLRKFALNLSFGAAAALGSACTADSARGRGAGALLWSRSNRGRRT